MYPWFNPEKAAEYPKRKVFIQPTTLGDAIEMRAAKDGDEASQCFDPETELAALWDTLKGSGLNVKSVHLTLYGADGEKITPDVPHPDPENDYGYAYTAAQLKSMPAPKNLFMLRHKFGAPCFSVSAIAYTPKAKKATASRKVARAAITRVGAVPAKPPTLKRGG